MNFLNKKTGLVLLIIAEACSWQASYTMQELRSDQAARYKQHLIEEYEKACQKGDIHWLQSNRELLLARHVVGQDELDMILETLQIPQKEAQEKERKQTKQMAIAEQTYTDRMKAAGTPQLALKNGIAEFYALRAGKDAHYYELIRIADIENLKLFFTHINELMKNSAIMDKVGQELQKLQSHMLYRTWENPKDLVSNTDSALKIFQNAITYKDISAMINIYRDFLKNSLAKDQALAKIYNDLFIPSFERNDTQALLDLYLNFFKESDQKEATLLLLEEYAQTCIRKKDIEKLKLLLVGFEGTEYEQPIRESIQKLTGITSPKGSSPKSLLYDEWQAASINRDLDKLLQLREDAIREGIVERATADAIIESLMK